MMIASGRTDRFKEWMRLSREEGLTDKVHILAGITPLKSEGMARYMANRVAGMDVPIPFNPNLEKLAIPDVEKIKRAVRRVLNV